MNNLIYFNYTNPLHRTAFGSINTVSEFYKKDVPRETVKSILSHNKVYTLKRRERKVKHYVPIYAYTARELLQIDLIEVRYMSRYNGGVHYLMMIYDTATKFAWCIPLKNKKGETVSRELDNFLKDLEKPVKRVLLDRGTEFTGNLSQKIFNKYNIKVTHPSPGKHASGVERLNQTFQNILYKFLSNRKKVRYIDHLQDLMAIYNSRRHRIIKMSPEEAELNENANSLATTLFEYYSKNILRGKKKQKSSKLFVNDLVHVKLDRKTFTRGYQDHYSKELYKIHSIDISKHIPLYSLKSVQSGDDNDENVLPTKYYEEDLLKVDGTLDFNTLIKIPPYTILKERDNSANGVDCFITWKNLPSYYNQWVTKELLLSKEILNESEM